MDNKLFLPVFDPLGILEKLTNGALRDPIVTALKGASPFSVNPTWLPPETRKEFLESYGEYATKTAEAFAPVGDVEAARSLARTFHERITTALIR